MRRTVFLLTLLAVTTTFAQTKRTIDSPEYKTATTSSLDITRVEADKDTTFLYVDIYGRPNYWVQIMSTTTLRGNRTGKEYRLLATEGVQTDKEHYLNEQGFVSCKLKFQPMDKRDDSFDFIEGEGGSWHISGISMLPPDTAGLTKCHIHGTVANPATSRLCLARPEDDERVDKITYIPVRNGRYSCDFFIPEAAVYTIFSYNDRLNGSWYSPTFVADGDTVIMNFDHENNSKDFTGKSEEMRKMLQVHHLERNTPFNAAIDTLNQKKQNLHKAGKYYRPCYYALIEYITENRDISAREHDSLSALIMTYRQEFTPQGAAIKQQQDSLRLLFEKYQTAVKRVHPCLYSFNRLKFKLINLSDKRQSGEPDSEIYNLNKELYDEIYSALYPGHSYHAEIATLSNPVRQGEPYADFSLRGNDGKEIKISSLIKGRVAVVHMWASWCGPCRRHGRELVPLYEKYKDRGFTVVGIAREAAAENMRAALDKEKYPWQNFLELQDEFGIWEKHGIGNSGGAVFLIDADGTLLAAEPTSEEIQKILKEKFGE